MQLIDVTIVTRRKIELQSEHAKLLELLNKTEDRLQFITGAIAALTELENIPEEEVEPDNG